MSVVDLVPLALTLVWPVLGVAALVGGGRLAARYVRAVEQRGAASAEQKHLTERLSQLEDALDEARSEIARLEAAQSFTTQLLTERMPERP